MKALQFQDMQRITWRCYTFLYFHIEKLLKNPKNQPTKQTVHQEITEAKILSNLKV